MRLRDPSELLAHVHALPGAQPVLDALAGDGPGPEVHLVGGAVRDLLLGGAPLDLDLVVAGELAPLAARLGAEVRPHERFATATVRGAGGARYDLARARRETYARPGALPDVTPASIAEDLRRRDFSVNALALGLRGPVRGQLLAVEHGLADLEAGRLRVLHPASFRDDPTRLLRLARYAARLGFEVEAGTAALAREALAAGALGTVSGPRIARELELLSRELDPVAGFAQLRAFGVDAGVAPGFGLDAAAAALARRALTDLPAGADPVAVLLGLAARGVVDTSGAAGLFAHLGLAATRRDAALAVAGPAPAALAAALCAARRPSEVDAALRGAPVEAIAVAAALAADADAGAGAGDAAARARTWLRAWRHTALEIAGGDLIAAGIPAGPAIAAGLRAARAAALDGRAAGREAQLRVAIGAAQAAG